MIIIFLNSSGSFLKIQTNFCSPPMNIKKMEAEISLYQVYDYKIKFF